MSNQPVKEFVQDAYRLVTSGSPTVPLHGNDTSKGVQFLNELLSQYSSTALLTTIASLISIDLFEFKQFVYFTFPDYIIPTPPPNNIIYYQNGRLSNLENAWIELDGVTYPLFDESRNVFFDSYKYFPLLSLPRYCVITNYVDYTVMQIYPAPSQFYELFVYGKFELPIITENGTMANIPSYQIRFLRLALAHDLALYKSRAEAWTDKHKLALEEAEELMVAASASNLAISSDDASFLNGAYRVRAGI